jgi:predicted RNase H-like nuclease (RuvC/YqgF family)
MAQQLAEQAGKLKPAVKTDETADRQKELDRKKAEAEKRSAETKIKKLEEENAKLEQRVNENTPKLEIRKAELADLESKVSSQSGDEKIAAEKKIDDLKGRIKNLEEKDIDAPKSKIEENKTKIEEAKRELESKTQALAAMTA